MTNVTIAGYRITSVNNDVLDPKDEIADAEGNVIDSWPEKEKAWSAIRKDLGASSLMGFRLERIQVYLEDIQDAEDRLENGRLGKAQAALIDARRNARGMGLFLTRLRGLQERILQEFYAQTWEALTSQTDFEAIKRVLGTSPPPHQVRMAGLVSPREIAAFGSAYRALYDTGMQRAVAEARRALSNLQNDKESLDEARLNLIRMSTWMRLEGFAYDASLVQTLTIDLDQRILLAPMKNP